MDSQEDRVGCSMTLKVGLPKYGSADINVSYSSSVREGEDEETAYERVKGFVDRKMEEAKSRLETMYDEKVEVEAKEESEEKPSKSSGSSSQKPGLPKANGKGGLPKPGGSKSKKSDSGGLDKLKKSSESQEENQPEEKEEEPKKAEEPSQESSEESSEGKDLISKMKEKYKLDDNQNSNLQNLRR